MNITKHEPITENSGYKSLIDFQKILSKAPAKESVVNFKQEMERQKGKRKSNIDYEYLPIGTVENELDSIYSGLWETTNEKFELVLNTIVCTLQLRVYHPIAQIWLHRVGTGGAQLQLASGQKQILPETLNHKAVGMAYKIAKEDATKNAAKSLGEIFGRNLNREYAEEVDSLVDRAEALSEHEMLVNEVIEFLHSDETFTIQTREMKIGKAKKATAEQLKQMINYYENKAQG